MSHYFNKSFLTGDEPEAPKAYLDIETLMCSGMSGSGVSFQSTGTAKKGDSATNPTGLVQDLGPSIFIPNRKRVMHNFRNLPRFPHCKVQSAGQLAWGDRWVGKTQRMKFWSSPSKASLHAEYNFSMGIAVQLHLSVLNLQAKRHR